MNKLLNLVYFCYLSVPVFQLYFVVFWHYLMACLEGTVFCSEWSAK